MITNDNRSLTNTVLDALDLAAQLDAVACGDDVKLGKPYPDLVHALCAKLGVPASETVLVGDGHNDLKMGRDAGCLATIGVTSGCDPQELLLAEQPDLVLGGVAELLTLATFPTIRLADIPRELAAINAFYARPEIGYDSRVQHDDRVIVAELDGLLLGCVRLQEEEGHSVLRGMYVSPTYQKRGIGKAMLAELLQWLDGRTCYCLPYEHLETPLYGRHGGFRRVDPAELPQRLRERLTEYHRKGATDIIAMFRPGV
jgi:N-acetylglutamate synthase-like GNAT family acetyltransferase